MKLEHIKLHVLAIAAHRDDTEITCGGTIIKLVDLGYSVGILDLTAGESGSRGNADTRADEARCASGIMGLKFRHNLELPDAGLFLTQENALKIAEVVRQTTPELVILPYWKQRHPDHATASDLGYRGCFLAGLSKMPIPGDAYRPRKIIYTTSFHDIEHNFVVDITSQFERKCRAVACYKTQFEERPDVREVYPPARNIFDYMEIRARQYGYMIGVKYAECFVQKEKLAVDDPLKLPGKSI
ncbi:MAG: bacillithiol biosynthesis deacetylase BshB1 [candidate division Zixibacteria bacterium RBG_16_53_22]|nr:MAG: bacillithiol biosynthesis deacetylase BshB1 [candidate division Zixibacteria bacterium RBG_16_53_22]